MPEYDSFQPSYQEEVVDFGGNFKDENEVTSPDYPAEGLYHAVLSKVDATGKNFPGAVFMHFEVLGGTVPNEEGKTTSFAVWPVRDDAKNVDAAKKTWQKNVLQLMLALGVRKRGEFPTVTFNEEWWNSLEGKQCIVKVTHEEQSRTTDAGKVVKWISAKVKGKESLFAIGDESVKEVPLDEQTAQLGGYLGGGDI